jgi:ABC transporter with metal-binding/Fe-S-binding domain ATP-binding protein
MKIGVLFSGGKDSCLALYRARKVDLLLSMMPENKDSWMFHKPDLPLLRKQAEMLGIPLIIQRTAGEKDKELEDLRKLIKKSKIDKLIIGGLASSYQGSRIEKISKELGIKLEAPLWGYDGERLWQELLKNEFKIIITKISCEGIPREFLGKIIDDKIFSELKKLSEKFKFRLDFEGGEAETAVLFMPRMKKEIKVKGEIESEGKYRHFLKIKKVF